MELALFHPDWRVDNLPRIRDVVDQVAQSLRNRMLGAEEGWVGDPPEAWRRQTSPLLAHTTSFLTRTHDIYRLRWQLRDLPDDGSGPALTTLLEELGGAGGLGRAAVEELTRSPDLARDGDKHVKQLAPHRKALRRLRRAARALAMEALKDLGQLLIRRWPRTGRTCAARSRPT
jgi:hypothetical protein